VADSRIIIAVDPGERRNGLAIFYATRNTCELKLGLRPTTERLGEIIEQLASKRPIICYELYRVYNSKLSAHRFSRVQTIESIGMLEYLIKKYRLECHKSMAVNHKTNTSPITKGYMQSEGYWGRYAADEAEHIRDATRVGLYWWKIQGILNDGKRVITDYDRRNFASTQKT